MGPEGNLRLLKREDISAATELSTEANWNQTTDDWKILLELAPAGCLAIEIDGEIAATTTVLPYDRRLAWIGMVLTKMKFRGRGLARRLLTEALHLADGMKIESVKLDATAQGQPLYEKFGFRAEQAVERWAAPGTSAGGKPMFLQARAVSDLDLPSFGADRSQLLQKLARRNPPIRREASCLFTRPGRQNTYLGPAVCEDSKTAHALFEQGMQAGSPSGWFWDLLPENGNALTLAEQLGFRPQRQLTRMVRGKDLRGNEEAIYAIAGFELG